MKRVQSVLIKREKYTYTTIPEMVDHRFAMRQAGWKPSSDERFTVTYEKEYRNDSADVNDSNN